ncbi:MAG: hypothetical protein AAGA03_05840 [Planctomycetota bacterium]
MNTTIEPQEVADRAEGLVEEDFRRVGVQVMEVRVEVIRDAAHRRSTGLAEQGLKTKSVAVERQLLSVVLSTYRLMDPRKRVDPKHQAYVGRILPLQLAAAGRTRFRKGPFQVSSHQADSVEAAAEKFDVARTLLVGDARPQPKVSFSGVVPEQHAWVESLQSRDLVTESKGGRQLKRFAQWLKRPIIASVAVALLVVTCILVGLGQTKVRVSQPDIEQGSQREMVSGTRVWDQANAQDEPLPIAPRTSQADQVRNASGANMSSISKDLNREQVSSLARPATSASSDAIAMADLQPDPAPIELGNDETDEILEPANAPENPAAVIAMAAAQPATSKPDAAESVAIEPMIVERAATEPATSELAINELATGMPATQVALAKEPAIDQVRKLAGVFQRRAPFPGAAGAIVTPASFDQWVDQIEAMVRGEVPSSDSRFASEWLIAGRSWGHLRGDEIHQRVNERLVAFSFDRERFLSRSYLQQTGWQNSEAIDSLLAGGGWLIDHLVRLDRFELVESLMPGLAQVAARMERPALVKWIANVEQTMLLVDRQRERREDVLSVADASPTQAFMKGKHLCYVCRRWSDGLPWLAVSSNRRVAKLAQDELQLADHPESAAQLRVAQRWAKLAVASKGRDRESMTLHAIELAQQIDPEMSAIHRLQAERNLMEWKSMVPSFLLPASLGPL